MASLRKLNLELFHSLTTATLNGYICSDYVLSDNRDALWVQGESDTSSAELAEAYTSKMEALIHSVRADLNHPDLPIIQASRHLFPCIIHLSSC